MSVCLVEPCLIRIIAAMLEMLVGKLSLKSPTSNNCNAEHATRLNYILYKVLPNSSHSMTELGISVCFFLLKPSLLGGYQNNSCHSQRKSVRYMQSKQVFREGKVGSH